MGVFRTDAADILPGAGEDRAEFGFALVRKGRAQIGEPDTLLRQERAQPARDRPADIARTVRPERAGEREHAAHHADHGVLGDLPEKAPREGRVVDHGPAPAAARRNTLAAKGGAAVESPVMVRLG
jgi:hypothetical protein